MKTLGVKKTLFALSALIIFSSSCGIKLFKKKVKEQKVQIETEYGKIVLKLYNETPKHRDNFVKLVKDGFYNDLLFHRVMQGFMIQGGDPDSKGAPAGKQLGMGGPGYTVPANFDSALIHKKGALAAARMPDNVNPQKASSGSQFYIVQGRTYTENELQRLSMQTGVKYTPEQIEVYTTKGGTPFLDMQYTVFGEVVEGLDVIDKIAAVKVDAYNRPVTDVKFTITLVN
jgi:peptidyl-prolyl cis-trans isomerase B (cyclophilin B)